MEVGPIGASVIGAAYMNWFLGSRALYPCPLPRLGAGMLVSSCVQRSCWHWQL